MTNKLKTIRLPFSFTLVVKKMHNGITFVFNTFQIEGWAKKRGSSIVADIDKVYLDSSELKGDLEAMEGIDEVEEAANMHVHSLFNQNQLLVA